MTEVVWARMHLYVNSDDDAVLDEFDRRFPREAEERWKNLTFPKDDRLGRNLDAEMAESLIGIVRNLDMSTAASMEAFGSGIGVPAIWRPGSSGQHEKDGLVGLVGEDESRTNWTIEVQSGDPPTPVSVEIRARVYWAVVDVPE